MVLEAAVGGSSLLQALLVALFTAVIGAALAYGVGLQVTDRWDEKKRRREADLSALADFYRLYGDFFTTWKLWNAHKWHPRSVSSPDHTQWALLQRAEAAEGGFEALIVKLVAERELDERDIALLGCFREGYQTLRETIRADKALGWWSSARRERAQTDCAPSDPIIGFLQYRAFKGLAEHFAVRLAMYPRRREPSEDAVFDARLLKVTNREAYVRNWWKLAAEHLSLPRPEGL